MFKHVFVATVMASSDAALAEIRAALGYTGHFKYNYGYVSIRNFGH